MKLRTGAALGLLLVSCTLGCSPAGAGDGVATAGRPAAAAGEAPADGKANEEKLRDFARCMREHGVEMPDPDVGPGGNVQFRMRGGEGDKQVVEKAQEECRPLLPNGGQPPKLDPAQLEQQREMARCMRENGVPNFPDPEPDGQIKVEAGAGLDPGSPAFAAAQEKCAPPGASFGSSGSGG